MTTDGVFFWSFKSKSLFLKTFSILILLCITMIFVFNYAFSHVVIKNRYEKEKVSNLAALHQIGESMELTFSILSQNMLQSVWGNDCVAFMINPYKRNTERDSRIIRLLRSHRKDNNLVLRAYLHSSLSNMLYSDDGQSLDLNRFADKEILEYHLNNKGEGVSVRKQWKDATVEVVAIKNRLFIFLDFIIARRLGTFFFELNLPELYRIVGDRANLYNDKTYVYDSNGMPVFGSIIEYPRYAPDFSFAKLFLTQSDQESNVQDAPQYYLYRSDMLAWRFVRFVDHALLTVWFDETLRLILPPLSVLVIASAVFLLYVTFNIYRPINRLMRSVVMEKPETARDEIDYLETAYRRTFDKQGRLVGLIESISPNILENLIREFIAGHELDERSALDILNNIGNPIGIRDRFCVMVGSVVSLQKENPTEDGISLYCADVRKTVESLCVPDARLFFLLVENNLIVVVIDFPSIVSLSSVRQSVMRLEGEILGALKNDSKRLIFGRGKVYSSVYDLRYSYQEALDDLKYAHYCLEGNKDVLGDAWQINDKLYRRLHVEGRAMHIVNSAEAGNAEEALQLSERVIQEVQENTEDTRSFGELCGFLRDAIIKTLNSRYSTGQNLRLNQMWDDCDDLSMIEDAAIIQKRIGEFCANVNPQDYYKCVRFNKQNIV